MLHLLTKSLYGGFRPSLSLGFTIHIKNAPNEPITKKPLKRYFHLYLRSLLTQGAVNGLKISLRTAQLILEGVWSISGNVRIITVVCA